MGRARDGFSKNMLLLLLVWGPHFENRGSLVLGSKPVTPKFHTLALTLFPCSYWHSKHRRPHWISTLLPSTRGKERAPELRLRASAPQVWAPDSRWANELLPGEPGRVEAKRFQLLGLAAACGRNSQLLEVETKQAHLQLQEERGRE